MEGERQRVMDNERWKVMERERGRGFITERRVAETALCVSERWVVRNASACRFKSLSLSRPPPELIAHPRRPITAATFTQSHRRLRLNGPAPPARSAATESYAPSSSSPAAREVQGPERSEESLPPRTPLPQTPCPRLFRVSY